MGVFKFIALNSLFFAAFVVLVGFIPVLPDFKPKIYEVKGQDKLEGVYLPNGALDSFKALHKDNLFWPESLALGPDGAIYTGTSDGTIKKVTDDKVSVVARTGKPCDGNWQEHLCGRPLGLRFDSKGLLHAVDAYHGYHIINVQTGSVQLVLPSATVVDGHNLTFLNDLVLTNDAVYFTQSSTKYTLSGVVMSIFEHESSGRLLKYSPKTKSVQVLAKDLAFPNGIQISDDNSFLLLAETTNKTILRYDLSGPKKGLSLLIDNLPGSPDNIRPSLDKKHYWVALNNYKEKSKIDEEYIFSKVPELSKFIASTTRLIGLGLVEVTKYYQCPKFSYVAGEVYSGRILADLQLNTRGMIIKFNEEGKIVKVLSSLQGGIAKISEVLEVKGHVYLGSWRNHFLAKVAL